MKATMETKVKKLYREWVERFLREWEEEGRYSPAYLPPTDEDFEYLKQEQIEFIGIYLGHMLIDGDSKENLLRIKHFLSMQGATKKDADLTIKFLSGNPVEVYLYANDLDEIDVADVFGIVEFKTMQVYLQNGQIWTQKPAAQFIESVREDLEFDGLKAELHYEFRNNLLEIECKIQ